MQQILLDTSIILDNTQNLIDLHNQNFELFITDIVLEELDKKKDQQSESGFFAREFFRRIHHVVSERPQHITPQQTTDHITCLLFQAHDSSVPIIVITRTEYHAAYSHYGFNDARIREIAKDYNLHLLTNDIALRVRSLTENISSSSLNQGAATHPRDIAFIHNITLLRNCSNKVEFEQSEQFRQLSNWHIFEIDEIDYTDSLSYTTGRKYFGIKQNNMLEILDLDSIIEVHKPYILPLNIEQKLAYAALLHQNNYVSIITGSTGSGKTLTALQAGIALQKMGIVDGIVYLRNTITANDKEAELGFRKGDEDQKLHYFMYPLFSSINFIIERLKEHSLAKRIEYKGETKGFDKEHATQYFLEKHRIEVMDIAHARGITLHNKFVIFDEVQNASDATIKLIGTRMGEKSRIVFLGDYNQIDHPYLSRLRNGALSLLLKAQKDDFIFGLQLKYTIRSEIASWFDSHF